VHATFVELKPYLEDFRIVISFLNSSHQRIAAYRSFCVVVGVRPRKFGLDMEVRWNSTYLMLKDLIPYKNTFYVFILIHYHPREKSATLLSEAHWYVAEKILEFLERFYDSIVVMSGVHYPTSPLMLHHILHINKHKNMYENDNLLRHVVVPMKDKFLKYWGTIAFLYVFAFIHDPRATMRGFNNVLALMSQLTHSDYSGYVTPVRAELPDLFNKYDDKFDSVRLQRTSNATPSEGKSKYAWDLVFGAGADGIGSSSSMALGAGLGAFGASSSMGPELSRRTFASALLHAASTPGIYGSKLAAYLDSNTV
jgi:hypothetical protein